MSLLKDFAHLQIPLVDILSATNNFSDENLIREGGFGRIYRGQLLHSKEKIDIVARRLDPKYGQGNKELLTGISILSSLKHPNLVSLVGFCDENEEKIIINKYEANSSLDKYLSDPTLTWTQRLKICVRVAHALSYIYYDVTRGFGVIHRNIKSSKILLDHNWEPKLSGFEHAVKNPATRRHRLLLTDLTGTYGYVDPACQKTGSVTHKSDMFSFGVVLFEVLCGRRAFIAGECDDRSLMFTMKNLEEHDKISKVRLLSHIAKSHYKKGNLDAIINPDLRKQMDKGSYKIFSKAAYDCLKEERVNRPDIDQVLQRLEKALRRQQEHDQKLSKDIAEMEEDTTYDYPQVPSFLDVPPFQQTHIPTFGTQARAPSVGTVYSLYQAHVSSLLHPHASGNIMSFSLREFAHLYIKYEDISKATNNFASENIIGLGGAGKLYKGNLKKNGKLIDIVAWRLEGIHGQGEIGLWTEISMLSIPRHKNMALVIGFCDQEGEKIIIYQHTVHDCLDKHLRDSTLTWSQRLKICLGVAHALNYIHYDFIHCGLSSSTVLIDKDGEAKVFGFGLSTRYPGNWMHRLLLSHFNKSAKYINLERVTPKYDVYSFGLLLYDVLCAGSRENGVKEKLDESINPDLRKQMSTQSLTTLSNLVDSCLYPQPVWRPTMAEVVNKLEDLDHTANTDEAKPSNILTNKKMESLKISLSDIMKATNNFDDRCYIGSGGFAKVYKAELDHLDIKNMLPSDWENKSELPKKRSLAAIKRISSREGKEGFFTEIETLTSCNHPNVVLLLGFSDEDSEMILVFEFALNGCLDTCLEKDKMKNVTWAQRIQICLDVARGLQYLHTNMEGKRTILHRDVKSANILLDENWNAKVADFGLAAINRVGNTMVSAHATYRIAGTDMYIDPEYKSTLIYKRESDIYSLGVVLFEILSGRVAYDQIYNMEKDKGLSIVARQHFNRGTIKELIDPNMIKEADEHIFTINKEPNQKSLDAFTKIAYRCLAEKQVERPKLEVIIKELEDALSFQGKSLVLRRFKLSDILSATEKFSAEYCIGVGAYGTMYNAKLQFDSNIISKTEGKDGGEQLKRCNVNVAVKRIFKRENRHAKHGFFAEIDTLSAFEHPNVVSLLGIASEEREMVLIYKDDFKRSLHDYLRNTNKVANLTWAQRIQISLDIAHGFNYLQTSIEDRERILHFDINSTNILLDAKWRAKIACFWHSRFISADKEANILNINNIVTREVQSDPEYIKLEMLKKESGIYSFGVILFEIMCGKVQYDESYYAVDEKGLPIIARRCFEERTLLKEMVDPSLKEETDEKTFRLNKEVNQDSFDAFSKIAYECCAMVEADRPLMEDIIKELEKALKLQEKHFEHFKSQVVEKVEHLEDIKHLKIPLSDILVATKNFSKHLLIGSGGYSKVYKAKLGHFDGIAMGQKNKGDLLKRQSNVAIKRINSREDEQGAEGFIAELQTLSKCKHPNIVSLLGYCHEDNEMILVLEYTSNGSLDDILRNSDKMTYLTWAQRIQICLDIARGLSYLHTTIKDQQTIHRDIKSANILLNDNWVAKIADFGLRIVNHAYQQPNNMETNIIAGTKVYLDPEYVKTGRLKKESDIYSLGVVLFEIMCGKLAYHKTFNERGLATIARKSFEDGTLKQIIDPRMSKDDENIFMLNGGLNQDSLDTFSKIAYQCLEETQAKRPKIEAVIKELERAYSFQTNSIDKLQISLDTIKSITEDFSDRTIIGEGRCWKQYEGKVAHANKIITLIAKRFDSKSDKQRHHFSKELEILSNYKHENIIGLEGYYQDTDEAIIIYKCASNGRLNEHLGDTNVTWMTRLKICIDVACGLHFLHTSSGAKKDIWIIHTNIKSSCILLNRNWRAKISNLESSLYDGEHKETEDVANNSYGSLGYMDPEYKQSGELTHKSDIYSLGVVLIEILCGRLAWVEGCEDPSDHSLVPLAKQCFKEGKLDELVFEGIKEQIDPESLTTFVDIALKCLKDDRGERPEASEVVTQLRKALEIYVSSDHMYEPKLPGDYEEILRLTKLDNTTKKKDIYDMLRKGVLLRDREVCLSLGSNGEKQYMISAKKFSYKNRSILKWRHTPKSRFEYVAEILAPSSLNIKCKIRTRFLSPGVNYGVHFVFNFCGPRKNSDKPMYVKLTYKMGSDTFHAYFATWRDDDWMTIELCQFLNNNEGINFELQLESISSQCSEKGAIYVEGIEFRVIDNVKHEKTEKTKEVQQVLKSYSNASQLQQLPSESEEILRRSGEDVANKLFSLNEWNIKKQLMLSAKEALYDSSNVKHFHVIPSSESSSQEVIEVLPQQVLRISCKIQSQMLSQDTKYSCYLVFKLSEKCRGLHCPVKVRDLGRRNNKEDINIYFRSPDPWNLHHFNHLPEQRGDGWMEVNVWNFHSNHKLQNDYFWANLKLISYEGTMAGLIVCGLEYRPM